MAPNILKATSVNVVLRNKEEKTRWAALAPLDSMPSRYPHDDILSNLGIKDSWGVLLEAGHLTHLFRQKYGSYKALTVEFLSTLKVNHTDGEMESITFRLVNEEYTMTLSEFNGVFQLMEGDEEGLTSEPAEYDRNDFWSRITLEGESSSEGPPAFNPSRAKINSIRNPTLRFLAKALVFYPFAHKELGSISSEMLLLLWGMLAHRRVNTGYFMIRHLERHAKKKSGKICCGGVVTALAHHFGVNLQGRIKDIGSTRIDWESLKKAGMIMIDGRGVGYFILAKNTYFKFPDPQLTAVGGWTYDANWKMNSPDHMARMASDPPQGQAHASADPMWVAPHYIPQPHIPNNPLPVQDAPASMEGDEEEATMEEEEAESSQPKRSRPRGRPSRDSQLADIMAGLRSVQLGQSSQLTQMRQWREDDLLWRAQQESRLEHFETQIQHLQDQGDARWAEEQAFYRAYYARFPPSD